MQLDPDELDTIAGLLTSAAATAVAVAARTTTHGPSRSLQLTQPCGNPECAGCGLTAADLPDEIGESAVLVFEPDETDGQMYCQGCKQSNRRAAGGQPFPERW